MLSVEEAREKILGKTLTTPTERVPIHEALGRILSEDIVSDMDSPPFSNSSMDGFAVIASDLSAANTMAPITLDVVGDAPAGRISESSVKRGEAIRIMTGAPLPDGADSVAPVEITNINPHNAHDQLPEQVQVLAPVNRGDNVRPQGEDFSVGQIIFSRGRKLYPQDIGLLSMLGISKIPVHIQPKIGILSTGDELLDINEKLVPGKIRNSNAFLLAALVEDCGGKCIDLGIALDNETAIMECLIHGVNESVDLLISTAGVSVGAFDFVRGVVERHGSLNFWKVTCGRENRWFMVNIKPFRSLDYPVTLFQLM